MEEQGGTVICPIVPLPYPSLQDNTQTVMGGKFRGTPRYAPLASHKLMVGYCSLSSSTVSPSSRQDHARKDDIESWFYMLVDFCNASLPWKVATDLTEVR